jgi:hypothetical protein
MHAKEKMATKVSKQTPVFANNKHAYELFK